MDADSVPDLAVNAGECGRCRHVRMVGNDRGASFYLCQRAADDDRFPRYPRLPMHDCPGYEQIT